MGGAGVVGAWAGGAESAGPGQQIGVVLDSVDLTIREGEVFALLGPNGAGKTTTVRILATLTHADAGSASVRGYDVRREADKVRAVIAATGQFSTLCLPARRTSSRWAACAICPLTTDPHEPLSSWNDSTLSTPPSRSRLRTRAA